MGYTYCKGAEACPEEHPNCEEQFQTICVGHVTPSEEHCGDWLDSDCDGDKDNGFDLDGDGHLDKNKTTSSGHPCGWDCDDNDATVHPDAEEVCNGIDDNCNCQLRADPANRDTNADGIECGCSTSGCDSNVDEQLNGLPIGTVGSCLPELPDNLNAEDLNWGAGTPCTIGKLVCHYGALECLGATGPNPEVCDGLDNNCNGFADEPGFIDGEGEQCGSNIGVCEFGYLICNPVTEDMICVDQTTGTNPDICNGLNDDCDVDINGIELIDEDADPIFCTNGCPEYGVQLCVDGEYTFCDAPFPGNEDDEPCNGLDDDCDGAIDEGQECECEPDEIGPNAPDCTVGEMQASGLVCGVGKKDCECVDGQCGYGECYLACDPWVDGQEVDNLITWWDSCPEEQCDAWDWDCWDTNVNGPHLVDAPCDCDPNSPIPAIAQLAQLGAGCEEGLCTAGSQTCTFSDGVWQMLPLDCGAVGPLEEVCDELDNDCDGDIDEGLNSFEKVDMVFAIDITGSMEEEIQKVYDAISVYAVDFQQTDHRFALLLFPAPYNYNWSQMGTPASTCGQGWGNNVIGPPYAVNNTPYWNMTGLVTVDDFLQALASTLQAGLCCGSEPSYDVLWDLTSPQDLAQIGWRDDAYPYIFLLGDEDAQSWAGRGEAQIAAQSITCDGIGGCPCAPGNLLECDPAYNLFEVHCFTQPAHFNDYNDICWNDVSGDNVYDINSITADLLRGIFADVCLPSNQP